MRTLVLAALLLALADVGSAGQNPTPIVTVTLEEGGSVVGRLLEENGDHVAVETASGTVIRVPRAAIVTIEWKGRTRAVPDPNDGRLLFAPTGRPLQKGTGQFTDHYVLFPGVSYGVTDNLTLMGGISIIPGLSASEQLVYVAPKIGQRLSDRFAVSAGYLFARAAEDGFDDGVGVGFAVATAGRSDANVSVGLGVAHAEDAAVPILMIGGQARLSRHLFLLSENWLVLHEDFELGWQPFSVALRFCGDRLSVDFGVVLIRELISEGFPIPWLSFSYRLGPSPDGRAGLKKKTWPAPDRFAGRRRLAAPAGPSVPLRLAR